LLDVSCAAPTSCTAVGNSSFASPTADQSFIEQWDGSSWSLASKPAATGTYPILESVSCASATVCAAVGRTNHMTLIFQWDGANWSIATSPNRPGGRLYSLSGLSCPSAVSCFAAGSVRTDRYDFPLILEYG
jgi:hypothetical protein